MQQNDPYVVAELAPKLVSDKNYSCFRCPIKGCEHWQTPPARKPKVAGEVCPGHGIWAYRSGNYTYADYCR